MSEYPEPKSARDVLMNQGYKKLDNVLNEKAISRKKLSGATRYSYCPFCVSRVRRGGGDYQRDLKPLWCVTYKLACRASADDIYFIFERRYECEVCKDSRRRPREITLDDFISEYGAKPEELKPRAVKITPEVLSAIERGLF